MLFNTKKALGEAPKVGAKGACLYLGKGFRGVLRRIEIRPSGEFLVNVSCI